MISALIEHARYGTMERVGGIVAGDDDIERGQFHRKTLKILKIRLCGLSWIVLSLGMVFCQFINRQAV